MNLKTLFGPAGTRAAAAAALVVSWLLVPSPVAGQDVTPRVPVADVRVVGLERLTEAQILAQIGITPGDSITGRELLEAQQRLFGTGQFSDIQVFSEGDPDDPAAPVVLRFEVDERPLLRSVSFSGLERISGSAVRDSVGLRSGAPLDPAEVHEAEYLIRSMLGRKGYQVRRLEAVLEPVEDATGEVRLVFEVEEGRRVAIADVAFEGNQAFSDDRLEDVIGSRSEGFFWFRTGTYDEVRLQADLRGALPQFYAERGYIDFAVTGDSLVVDPQTGKGRLVIRVDEGPQYRLADFSIRGNRVFPTADLRRYFEERRSGLLSGLGLGSAAVGDSVFNAVAFETAALEVGNLYANQGYVRSNVMPIVERLPATDEDGRPAVRAAWEIIEGSPAYISRVAIEGNTYTHEDVIRQQLVTIPGDVYSQELVIQSYQRISALGFFETPLEQPGIRLNEQTGDIELTYRVKEKQTGSMSFGTTLGGYSGVAGFLGYDQPNLFGQAKSGHLRWEFGRYANNFEASYSDPSLAGSMYSGGVSVFNRRDRFISFAEGQRRQTGASLRFGIPVFDFRTRLSAGYSLSRTRYEDFDDDQTSSVFSLPPGVQSTVSLGLTRSTVDHPVFPTTGAQQTVELELNGGLLGGDGEFQKLLTSGTWWVPVGSLGGDAPGSQPIRLTLGLTAEAGMIAGDASRFPFDRFLMGGVQFGRPLRGYEEYTITPMGFVPEGSRDVQLVDRFGDAFLRLSAEYAMRLNDNISVGLFYDAGNVWRSPTEFNPTRLARGAGFGVMLVTPFGPLGLDYAYGFDRTDPGWQLHFKFGQGF
ncbi:MAG: outer membrane protein assembly factor BamA [Gemmatimonadota bacterium]